MAGIDKLKFRERKWLAQSYFSFSFFTSILHLGDGPWKVGFGEGSADGRHQNAQGWKSGYFFRALSQIQGPVSGSNSSCSQWCPCQVAHKTPFYDASPHYFFLWSFQSWEWHQLPLLLAPEYINIFCPLPSLISLKIESFHWVSYLNPMCPCGVPDWPRHVHDW